MASGLHRGINLCTGLTSFTRLGISTARNGNLTVAGNRFLYTKESLGLTGYEATRERTSVQLGAMKERFKTRMEQYLSGDAKALIFTEDLKNMLYLAENEKDIGMVERMMKKFAKQNKDMRFGSFVFGPVVMRMFYHLNKPEEALKAIQDPELASFFDQFTSYQVVMDLLYDHKRYDDVLKVFELLKSRPFTEGKFPKEPMVLVAASLYKVGTPEAYEQLKSLIKSAADAQAPIMRRAVTYCAYLALKNNDAAGALEILAIPLNQGYVTIRNLKALALLKLNRLEDVMPLCRSVVEQDPAFQAKPMPSFFSDVYAELKAAVEKSGDNELIGEYQKVFGHLESTNGVDQATLADFLEKPIEDLPRRQNEQGNRTGGFNNFNRRDQYNQPMRQPRYPPPQNDQQRQARYPPRDRDDGYQGGRRQSYGDSGSNPNAEAGYRGGRRQPYGGDRQPYGGGEGSNPNAEAGYRPRTGYQRYGGSGRQGLQDED